MAYIEQEDRLTRIFAKTHAGDRLIAVVNSTEEGPSRISRGGAVLYDLGNGQTYLPSYALGSAPARARIVHENPRAIQKAFLEAGVPIAEVPPIKTSQARIAIHRVATFFFPQKESAPAHKIR